jgi:hypothetical protein
VGSRCPLNRRLNSVATVYTVDAFGRCWYRQRVKLYPLVSGGNHASKEEGTEQEASSKGGQEVHPQSREEALSANLHSTTQRHDRRRHPRAARARRHLPFGPVALVPAEDAAVARCSAAARRHSCRSISGRLTSASFAIVQPRRSGRRANDESSHRLHRLHRTLASHRRRATRAARRRLRRAMPHDVGLLGASRRGLPQVHAKSVSAG